MTTDRLAQLQRFYDEDPDDPFNIYGLALEYLKFDEQRSSELFAILLEKFPNYTATYYHAGKLAEKKGDVTIALQIYEAGMERCRDLGEVKALRELRAAHDELAMD
jgi:hypothetical protein